MENGNRNTQYQIQKERIVRVPKASNIRLVVKYGVTPRPYNYIIDLFVNHKMIPEEE